MRGLLAPLIKLAVFVTVTVLVTAMLAVTIANANSASTNNYTAIFTDATSLLNGDDVRIAGVKVGQVQNIELTPTGSGTQKTQQAKVSFTVDKSITLPRSVCVAIKYRNLVGQRYLALDQGQAGQSQCQGGPQLASDSAPLDANKPITNTKTALDLTQLFRGFQPLFNALSPNEVNQLSDEVVQVLQGEGGTVESLLSHTASLTSTLADKDQVIGEVIDNLNSALGTLNAHGPQLSDTISTVQQLVTGFAADRQPIGDAIQALSGLADTTAGLLSNLRQPLKQDITQLGILTNNLNRNQPTVEHFIQFLPEKLKKIIPTASYGSWFNFLLCSAEGSVTIPGLINQPISIPALPNTEARCQS